MLTRVTDGNSWRNRHRRVNGHTSSVDLTQQRRTRILLRRNLRRHRRLCTYEQHWSSDSGVDVLALHHSVESCVQQQGRSARWDAENMYINTQRRPASSTNSNYSMAIRLVGRRSAEVFAYTESWKQTLHRNRNIDRIPEMAPAREFKILDIILLPHHQDSSSTQESRQLCFKGIVKVHRGCMSYSRPLRISSTQYRLIQRNEWSEEVSESLHLSKVSERDQRMCSFTP
jgi:hypothetical protein